MRKCAIRVGIMSKPTRVSTSDQAADPIITEMLEPFIHPIRVGWADCDPALMAFTGRIPGFALEAIDAWWECYTDFDWFRLNVDRNIGTPFVHMEIDFESPVTPRHILECSVELINIGKTSFTHRVEGHQDGVLCFVSKFVSVCIVADKMKPQTPPRDLMAAIEPILKEADDRSK